jgi:peptidoglycan hydrolase CwlO-like protein
MNIVGKIAVIVTLLATAAGAFFSFQVKQAGDKLISDLETKETRITSLQGQVGSLTGDLEATQQALNTTSNNLVQASGMLTQARNNITNLNTQLEQAQSELQAKSDELEDSLARMEQIETTLSSLQERASQATLTNEQLQDEIQRLKQENQSYASARSMGPQDEDNEPGGPPRGLSGNILLVNDDWNFVVLNLGSKHGVRQGNEFMIHRDGRLISKVRVRDVQEFVSIADILPSWQRGEVNEGDPVLY